MGKNIFSFIDYFKEIFYFYYKFVKKTYNFSKKASKFRKKIRKKKKLFPRYIPLTG